MRILQILPELNVGGVETGTVDLAKYLMNHGHRAVVVSAGGSLVSGLERSGIQHYQLPVQEKSLWTILRCIRELKKIIEKEDIEIVHARSRVPAWIAYFACRQTKAKFLTTCHGYYSGHFFSRIMGWSKFVIVPSQVIGRHMIDSFHVPAERIRLIPRSVDLERFHNIKPEKNDSPDPVVAIVGRLTPLKGHEYFLKAMAQVIRQKPLIKVWIIGDAPLQRQEYRQDLEVLARRLGISHQVEFLGNRDDVPELLAKTDLLAMSSIVPEAFGRVILEAQAAGVPVVATKVGGVIEIIDDGKTGLLVSPKDPADMAQAILKILNNKILAQQLTGAARQKLSEKFTLEKMAEATLRVYAELLNSLNILVIKLSSVGDVVLVTPSLRALREKFPHAKIHCLVGQGAWRVLKRCPYLDGLLIYDPQKKDQGGMRFIRFASELRKYQFDMVVDFQNNRKSHLLGFLTLAKQRLGYDRKWGGLLTQRVKDESAALPPVEHQFAVLKLLDINRPLDLTLELWPTEKDEEYAQRLLAGEWLTKDSHIVGINIAASGKWVTKNWPLSHMARLCDLLGRHNIRVIITGMAPDQYKAQQLSRMTKSKPADFVGKTDILQLAVLIRYCKVYITVDSAPMHVAAAMKTPFLAFFGPTDPSRHLPPAAHYVVMSQKLECAPCYSSRCRILTHACMNQITPEEVALQVEKLMTLAKR